MPSIYLPAEDSYLLSKVLGKEIPELLKKNEHLQFLEIGSGSGILLETAKKLGIKREHIFGADINQEAVEHCKSLDFNCIYSDLFENVQGKYDIIVFNPPYLPADAREPENSQLATTGGLRGSEIINEFLKEAVNYLEENGKIFLLTSSLTKNINWRGYNKKLLGKEKLFFEELMVWELRK
ncbi:methyltransferase [Candidatus Pacearchaeota archaeon]|nr:methyltransferase [Candidatus Pacearchaeota archaeon]